MSIIQGLIYMQKYSDFNIIDDFIYMYILIEYYFDLR